MKNFPFKITTGAVKISRKLPALVVCFMAASILGSQVEAMSTERSVRVRVKVYDNTTSIYSQDIEISQGEGTFIVPAILADSDVIALQVCCCLLSSFVVVCNSNI